MRRPEIAASGRRDIDRILYESHDRHGPRAAARYRRLIGVALSEIRQDPARLMSRSAEVGDLRLYALRFAARGLAAQEAVRSPPHIIAYSFDEARVTVLRLLHEAMDLPRQLYLAVGPEGLDMVRDDRARDDEDAGGED